jgi:hypothetical protein
MHIGKIDVTKIDKSFLFKGKSGTYLDVALIPNMHVARKLERETNLQRRRIFELEEELERLTGC